MGAASGVSKLSSLVRTRVNYILNSDRISSDPTIRVIKGMADEEKYGRREVFLRGIEPCLLYTSPSPRDS